MVTRSLSDLFRLSGFLLVVIFQRKVEAFSLHHESPYKPSCHQWSSHCHSASIAAAATIVIMSRRTSRMMNIGASSTVLNTKRNYCAISNTPWNLLLLAKSNNEDDDETEMGNTAPGMKDAFRQLEALESIGNDDDSNNDSIREKSSGGSSMTTSSPMMIQPPETMLPLAAIAPPEKQVQVYTEMVKELEQQDQEDLYSDVLAEMGIDPSTMISSKKSKTLPSFIDNALSTSSSSLLDTDTEKFMNQALQEALQEAAAAAAAANKDKNKAGGSTNSMADSVLNNKEIMKEIEQIFERGNDQLMESIEEMRTEQRELAKASAEDNAQSAMDNIGVNTQRLARAESSMVAMLERVNKETAAVEKAVQDLQQAQMEMSNNKNGGKQSLISKLRQGGIPKQAALVGLLLFSFRSIADSIAAMGGGESGGDMTAALIQGTIAMACGVYLILF